MSLIQRNSRLRVGRKPDVSDLHRFDADAAKNEFAVDGFADAHIHELSVAGERRDRIVRTPESADVFVGENRRHRGRWLRRGLWHHRLRLHYDGPGWRGRWRWGRLLVREEVPFAPVAATRRIEPLHVYTADARGVDRTRSMGGRAGSGGQALGGV